MSESEIAQSSDLYPEIEPYNFGYLPIETGHEIYFEQCGNPKGLPAIFFHGGPGAGCDSKDRRYFDGKKWRVILSDQRGCGRSKPFGKIDGNTTWDLIEDTGRLINYLKIPPSVFWGSSWGSTMALLSAIRYPGLVVGLNLRGIFLGETGEIDYSDQGLLAQHYPEKWTRFIKNVPPLYRLNPIPFFYKKLLLGTPEERRQFSRQWSNFEDSCLHLAPLIDDEIEKGTSQAEAESIALLETHYFHNDCFLENGYILKNVRRIPNVPISITHGRYDVVCPPRSAYRLYNALKTTGHDKVQLHFTIAGHSKSDPENQAKLLSETNRVYQEVVNQK